MPLNCLEGPKVNYSCLLQCIWVPTTSNATRPTPKESNNGYSTGEWSNSFLEQHTHSLTPLCATPSWPVQGSWPPQHDDNNIVVCGINFKSNNESPGSAARHSAQVPHHILQILSGHAVNV